MKGILPDDVLWRKKSPYPKTHNPTYLAEVIRRMRAVLADKDCRLTEIVSREKLMEKLWETDSFVDENTLTVNVNRLRKKLDAAGLPGFIATKFGVGYQVG